jgi:hypothetical protein
MYTHPQRRRSTARAARMIGLAAMAGLGLHHLTPGGGGGAVDDAKGEEKKPEAKGSKIELSAEEFAKKLDAAKDEALKEFEAKRAKEKEAEEAAAAQKRGEFEKLYQSEAGRVKELEGTLAATRLDAKKQAVALKLQRHLSANHKDYAENDIDILPHIQVDAETPDDEIEKRIKAATESFVKRTPKASPLNGAPSGARRGKIEGGAGDLLKPAEDRNGGGRLQGPLARF